ncbi:MAG: hypothetical protein L6V93_05910 [Clostridiales bacterium]|nr:MAG: hypothetical protein L6V93_05910 [Clostridiales bacterium]
MNEFGAKKAFLPDFIRTKRCIFLYDCDILPKYDKTAKKAKDALKTLYGCKYPYRGDVKQKY